MPFSHTSMASIKHELNVTCSKTLTCTQLFVGHGFSVIEKERKNKSNDNKFSYTWVVFPDPVSPTRTKAWCSFMLSMNFSLYSHTGNSILFFRISKYLSVKSLPLKGLIFPRMLLGLLSWERRKTLLDGCRECKNQVIYKCTFAAITNVRESEKIYSFAIDFRCLPWNFEIRNDCWILHVRWFVLYLNSSLILFAVLSAPEELPSTSSLLFDIFYRYHKNKTSKSSTKRNTSLGHIVSHHLPDKREEHALGSLTHKSLQPL